MTLIRAMLVLVAILVCLHGAIRLMTTNPMAIDVIIPLRAVERWLAGGVAYLPDGFTDPQALPPFLYPPFVLPFLAPLTALPEWFVRWAWVAGMLSIGWLSYLWLGLKFVPAALALLWIPMVEGIWTGNIGVLLFAAFIIAFWNRSDGGLPAAPREFEDSNQTPPRVGFLAASLAAVKPSQIHAWLVILRRQPRSALIGLAPWIFVAVVTLPLVGLDAYGEWIAQVRRAADPSWPMMGVSLLAYVPPAIFGLIYVASILLAWRLAGRDLGAWAGVLIFIATPNMHSFNGLFLLPALLLIRREYALLAAILMSTYTAEGWWLGAAVVIGTMVAGARWPIAREPQLARGV
ncbi:MAG: DUF2029 domain-containing protein [Propionibacteriaceae bacterium]|nr:DUF2029 domain-containing protein [Propionibacteriaceae bacterium]